MTQGWGKLIVGSGESTGKSERQRGGDEKRKGEGEMKRERRDGERKRRRERVSVLGL